MEAHLIEQSRILVVDDEAANVSFLEVLLGIAGYRQIFSTTDPRRACDMFDAHKPDIVLLDLSMPFLDGFQVIDALNERFGAHHVPILVLTADATKSTKHRALGSGATDFLTKPLDADEVLLRISNLITARRDRQLLDQLLGKRTHELDEEQAKVRVLEKAALAAAQAKSDFLANMSHELRTPMNGIMGATSLLAQKTIDPDKKRISSIIMNSCRSLQAALDEILEISSLEAGHAEVLNQCFSPERVFEEAVALYEAEALRKGLTLSRPEITGSVPMVHGDPIRLRQAIGNIVSNSVKFTLAGEIRADWKWEQIDQHLNLVYRVKDTGIGISDSDQAKIFEAFSQADSSRSRKYGGVGLGLTIAQRNIQLLGGKLTLESQEGVGSTFTLSLSLPLSEVEAKDPISVAEPISPPKCGVPKVLLVEDNEINLMVAEEMFTECGCQVESAPNGLLAVSMSDDTPYDLIMMDIQMPVCDGVEATRQIRARESHSGIKRTPIVAMTANTRADDVQRYFQVGMDDVLPKPITLQLVKEHLQKQGISPLS